MKTKTLLLTACLFLTGCTTPGKNSVSLSSDSLIKVTDRIGREVKLHKKDAERVLCIGAGALRRYSYIGDRKKIIAAEDIDRNVSANIFQDVSRPYYDVNKEYLSTLPSCGKGGPQAQRAETEKILSCAPSLIISEYEDVDKANTLQAKTGVPVLVVKYGSKSVFDPNVGASFTLLGKALGKEERAKHLNNYILSCETELKKKAANANQTQTKAVYVGCLGNWGTQDIFSTSSSFPLLDVSSIPNAVKGVSLSNGKLEEEAFLFLNPETIVLDSAGLRKFKQTYNSKKDELDSLKAFRNNEIYLERPFNAYYTNLEIALRDAYYLASIAYPEAYKDRNRVAKYDEIGTAFLSAPCYTTSVKTAKMSYGGFQKITDLDAFLSQIA